MSSYPSVHHKRLLSQAGSSFSLVCFIVFVKVLMFQLYHRAHPHQLDPAANHVYNGEEDAAMHPSLGRRKLLQEDNDEFLLDRPQCVQLVECVNALKAEDSETPSSVTEWRERCADSYKLCKATGLHRVLDFENLVRT